MGINAFVQGTVTIAIAVIGLYFSWESRRADNYQAVADLALSSDANVAATAAETMELMTVDCGGEAATDLQAQRIRDIFCPLSTHHRFILNNMISAIREAEVAEAMAALDVSAAETAAPGLVDDSAGSDAEAADPDTPAFDQQVQPSAVSPDTLLARINDGSRSVRRTAVAELERNNLSDDRFVDALIGELEDPSRLGDLTVQGRFNVAYLLNHAPSSVWESEERVDRCLAAIDQVYARERAGETAIGDQTRAELIQLKSRLDGRRAARATSDETTS
ncbi:MAG: hypothetical protein AAF608_00285 [Pseudomonadota bacterium]